jgi:hypothetical protein
MFGLFRRLFKMSEPINTQRVDHFAAFKKVIYMAITEARDAHITNDVIAGYLQSRAKWLEDVSYTGAYKPPRRYDATTGQLVDYAKMADDAQRERQRRIDAACEIPRDQRQSAVSGIKVPR